MRNIGKFLVNHDLLNKPENKQLKGSISERDCTIIEIIAFNINTNNDVLTYLQYPDGKKHYSCSELRHILIILDHPEIFKDITFE